MDQSTDHLTAYNYVFAEISTGGSSSVAGGMIDMRALLMQTRLVKYFNAFDSSSANASSDQSPSCGFLDAAVCWLV